jgi:hypothetical protein
MQSRSHQTAKSPRRDTQIHGKPQKSSIGRVMGKLLGLEGEFTKSLKARNVPHKVDVRHKMFRPDRSDQWRKQTRMGIKAAS